MTVPKNFILLELKCVKFNCFMLQSQKMKCLVLSRYPFLDPLKNLLPSGQPLLNFFIGCFPIQILIFRMLRNNADVRRCS